MKLVLQIAAGVVLGLFATSLIGMLFAGAIARTALEQLDRETRRATPATSSPTTRRSPAITRETDAKEPSLQELESLREALESRDAQRGTGRVTCDRPWQITTRDGKRYSGCGEIPSGGLATLTPDP